MAAGCQRYFVPSLQSRARCKGGFYLEAESSLYCPKQFQEKHNHLCYSLSCADKGTIGESRFRKAMGLNGRLFRMAAGFLMQLLHSSLLLLKEGFS